MNRTLCVGIQNKFLDSFFFHFLANFRQKKHQNFHKQEYEELTQNISTRKYFRIIVLFIPLNPADFENKQNIYIFFYFSLNTMENEIMILIMVVTQQNLPNLLGIVLEVLGLF